MSLANVRRRALRALIPPPRLKLSDWIEANIVLPRARRRCRAGSGFGRISVRSPMPFPTRWSSA
jgi:hypothetical protein